MPPKLETYDGTTNPDEHVEHLDTILDYHRARGAIKCNLFRLNTEGRRQDLVQGPTGQLYRFMGRTLQRIYLSLHRKAKTVEDHGDD